METIEIIDVATSSNISKTLVKALTGKKLPEAFLFNVGGHAYAKFEYDQKSLLAFETKFKLIKN